MISNDFALQLNNISKTFPGVKALNNVSFELKRGEVHALVGENGAGKSTLIKILSGVYQPDPGGKIVLGWSDVEITDPISAIQAEISVIYQDISLFSNLTVAENICLGKNEGIIINWKRQREVARDALHIIGSELNPSMSLGELSIGVQQQVAIAKAVYFDAKLIVMDEPTASLSSGEVKRLYQIVDTLREKGITVLYISHKFDEIYHLADRITILRDGNYVGTYPKEDLSEDELVMKMVGRRIEEVQKKENASTGEPLLELDGLSKKGVYSDIHFSLKKGEVVGFTGLVGAGRSELFQSVFGITRPDEGTIVLKGKAMKIPSSSVAVKHGIVYLPENRLTQGIIQKQSLKTNLTVAALRQLCGKLRLIRQKEEESLCNQWVEKLDIRPRLPNMNIENMSGGNQQKVVLGKWLTTNPEVFIADEPTAGVDIGAKAEIHRLIRDLAKSGMGVVVISSELSEILAVSDRVVVMKEGAIVDEMDIGEATQEKIMAKAL